MKTRTPPVSEADCFAHPGSALSSGQWLGRVGAWSAHSWCICHWRASGLYKMLIIFKVIFRPSYGVPNRYGGVVVGTSDLWSRDREFGSWPVHALTGSLGQLSLPSLRGRVFTVCRLQHTEFQPEQETVIEKWLSAYQTCSIHYLKQLKIEQKLLLTAYIFIHALTIGAKIYELEWPLTEI